MNAAGDRRVLPGLLGGDAAAADETGSRNFRGEAGVRAVFADLAVHLCFRGKRCGFGKTKRVTRPWFTKHSLFD